MEQCSDRFLLVMNLQFFAESAGGEKTEEATPKKISDARKEGQVARSTELITASSLIALFLVLKLFIGFIGGGFIEIFNFYYSRIPQFGGDEFTNAVASTIFRDVLWKIMYISMPVLIVAVLVAIIVNVYQVRWEPTAKPLKPKFSNMDPIKGFKKIISKDKIVDLIKSVLKIGIILYVVYNAMRDEWRTLLLLYDISLNEALVLIGTKIIDLGLNISILFFAIGMADLIYQKLKFKKDMKMTKQEIKDEYKQSEGDPQIKGQIKGKMREASQRRMMQALPEADVVITNPTHLAVAVKYDNKASGAPVVIAKGADFIAEKIKETAREHKIEIVENKPLARMLYYNVDLDQEIPQELYQMVAEVLAYVFTLKNKI